MNSLIYPLVPLARPLDAGRPPGAHRLRPGARQYPAPCRLRGSQRAASLGGAPRRLDARRHALQPVQARRQAVGHRLRALPREHRQPAHQPARLGHRGIRPVQAALRRHDPQRRRRSGVRHLRALPAAQSRAHQVRHRAARQGTGLDAQRDLRIRSREGALGRLAGRARRLLAQARQERRPVADADRQELGRRPPSCSRSATRPRSSASTR